RTAWPTIQTTLIFKPVWIQKISLIITLLISTPETTIGRRTIPCFGAKGQLSQQMLLMAKTAAGVGSLKIPTSGLAETCCLLPTKWTCWRLRHQQAATRFQTLNGL